MTTPIEAAESYDLVRDLLLAGMDVMRINSAHDEAEAWRKMTEHLNGPRGGVCKRCRVVVTANGIETVVVTETDEEPNNFIGLVTRTHPA